MNPQKNYPWHWYIILYILLFIAAAAASFLSGQIAGAEGYIPLFLSYSPLIFILFLLGFAITRKSRDAWMIFICILINSLAGLVSMFLLR